jgi:hypothetical protein
MTVMQIREDLVETLAIHMEAQALRNDAIRLTPEGIAYALILPVPTVEESLAVMELMR